MTLEAILEVRVSNALGELNIATLRHAAAKRAARKGKGKHTVSAATIQLNAAKEAYRAALTAAQQKEQRQ